jgi:23S rRNA (cytosine1962-C5)-methyltransferase
MLANRLRKNLARLGPWARREAVEAWRLYDRDIPELPYAIDLYGPRVLLTEYLSPVARRRSPAERAAEHAAVRDSLVDVLKLDPAALTWKDRERHRSVEREARGEPAHEFVVSERGHRFRVNLDDYLDTGLFLDHRSARAWVGGRSAGARILNLFCYTASFSVYAAKAGASATTSVDLSQPYLAWAARNFAENAVDPARHELRHADAAEFLRTATERYDGIVLDPPTISKSARGRSFDVQRDQGPLIERSLARLNPGGWLLFSTNYRQFQPDPRLFADAAEVTRDTTPPDFRHELHRCWHFRR